MKNPRHPRAPRRAAGPLLTASVATILAALASCRSLPASAGAILVNSQTSDNALVLVSRVVSEGPGWLVIHAEAGGAPGPVLGWAPVREGVNRNLRVRIASSGATQYLWAMLHVDAGRQGQYQFPGPDAPVTSDGQVVMKRFRLNRGYTGTGGMGGGY